MGKRTVVPDAWDDDWEAQADRAAKEEAENPTPAPILTKAERLEEHAKSNRKLWEAAESNETFHYVEATNTVPLAATFKPQVKVLSRKPVIAKRGDPSGALGQLSLDDDDEAKKEVQRSPEEVRAKQRREREEKQRRYDEARAKIFGESAPSSRGSSPGRGTTTPPRPSDAAARSQQQQQQQQQQGGGRGGGGRGRGGRGGGGAENARGQLESRRTPPQAGAGKLYDPNYSPKPDGGGGGLQRRDDAASAARQQIRDEGAPLRAPRGPDGTGRGGFGFARRGAREA